jgi:acyl carrier protein
MSVRDKVIELVNDVARPDRPDLSDTSRPLLSSGLDSLDFSTLLMAIEDRFGLTISDGDLAKLRSVDEIVAFVESNVK